jgi:hypothetical protein
MALPFCRRFQFQVSVSTPKNIQWKIGEIRAQWKDVAISIFFIRAEAP